MSENQAATRLPPRPFHRPATYLPVGVFLLFCLAGGAALMWMAFWTKNSFAGRLPALAMATVVLFFPAMFLFTSTRRKVTAGRWLPNEQDVATQREQDFRRAQSPVARRRIAVLKVFAGLVIIGVWIVTDLRVIQHHSLKSWWMVYITCLQLVLFWTYWKACRRSGPKTNSPGESS
jgi:hypothetical protein